MRSHSQNFRDNYKIIRIPEIFYVPWGYRFSKKQGIETKVIRGIKIININNK
jgi:hypothetical protein